MGLTKWLTETWEETLMSTPSSGTLSDLSLSDSHVFPTCNYWLILVERSLESSVDHSFMTASPLRFLIHHCEEKAPLCTWVVWWSRCSLPLVAGYRVVPSFCIQGLERQNIDGGDKSTAPHEAPPTESSRSSFFGFWAQWTWETSWPLRAGSSYEWDPWQSSWCLQSRFEPRMPDALERPSWMVKMHFGAAVGKQGSLFEPGTLSQSYFLKAPFCNWTRWWRTLGKLDSRGAQFLPRIFLNSGQGYMLTWRELPPVIFEKCISSWTWTFMTYF